MAKQNQFILKLQNQDGQDEDQNKEQAVLIQTLYPINAVSAV